MTNSHLDDAEARLGQALLRLERAVEAGQAKAAAPAPAPAPDPGLSAEVAGLKAQNAELKKTMGATATRIDGVLGRLKLQAGG